MYSSLWPFAEPIIVAAAVIFIVAAQLPFWHVFLLISNLTIGPMLDAGLYMLPAEVRLHLSVFIHVFPTNLVDIAPGRFQGCLLYSSCRWAGDES